VNCEFDPLTFNSPTNLVAQNKGDEGLEGSHMGELKYAPIPPKMLGDTQLIDCLVVQMPTLQTTFLLWPKRVNKHFFFLKPSLMVEELM
jgi:hypothetical protein